LNVCLKNQITKEYNNLNDKYNIILDNHKSLCDVVKKNSIFDMCEQLKSENNKLLLKNNELLKKNNELSLNNQNFKESNRLYRKEIDDLNKFKEAHNIEKKLIEVQTLFEYNNYEYITNKMDSENAKILFNQKMVINDLK
jgi:hypothetical protein